MDRNNAMKLDISTMLRPDAYNHPVREIVLIETHISWVLLTGDFAYKIKKPVDFDFLDFSTLEKRRLCCEQEVSLNRRLAPDIYLEVVSIAGSENKPLISGSGEIFEYAVKMVQFSQSSQLDNMLLADELGLDHMDAIAQMVAKFHQSIQLADDETEYGNTDSVQRAVIGNFIQINEHLDTDAYKDILSSLRQLSESEFIKLKSVFEHRKSNGFIRECHGDMHLRNMVWLDNGPTAFDCIEFNVNLRWIDVISEVSFLVMDLQARRHHNLANRFLNGYLESTGDYMGLSVMPFYLCYRALVRAKVDVLRLEQKGLTQKERDQSLVEFESYLALAKSYTQKVLPKLIIMRGVSASGKSTISQHLVDVLGVIRIRSDVERKRLFDIKPETISSNEIDSGIYAKQATQKTYEKLCQLASIIIRAGYSVVVDASFLKYEQREDFNMLAGRLSVPFIIVEVKAPSGVLRQRITGRKYGISDAGLDVLEHQLMNWRPLKNDEINTAISVNTEDTVDFDLLIEKLC